MLHILLSLGGDEIGPSEAEIPRDSNSPHLHNQKEVVTFVFKWIIIRASVTSLI
jgi:hypothetical protein